MIFSKKKKVKWVEDMLYADPEKRSKVARQWCPMGPLHRPPSLDHRQVGVGIWLV